MYHSAGQRDTWLKRGWEILGKAWENMGKSTMNGGFRAGDILKSREKSRSLICERNILDEFNKNDST